MKIIHINDHLARKGGVETYLLELLPRIASHGSEPVILYGTGDSGLYDPSFACEEISSHGFRAEAVAIRRIGGLLRNLKPDVVHVHAIQNLGVLKACLDYGPTIMTSHDYRLVCPASTYFHKKTRKVCTRQCGPGCFTTTLTKRCMTPRPNYAIYYYHRSRWMIRNSARLSATIAPSEDARRRLVAAGFPDKKIKVIPYFCPMEPRGRPRPVPDVSTITYIGRIAPNKGYEYFVEALGKLPASVHGVMVGNFSESALIRIKDLAVRCGCDNRLELKSWATKTEVTQILDRTSVFVFPSLWPETLGIVGLEALSRGVPVVASDIGGVREWLHNGENGYLVSPGSSDGIAEALGRVLSSRIHLESFGRNGIQSIRDKFLPSQHIAQLSAVYENVAIHRSGD